MPQHPFPFPNALYDAIATTPHPRKPITLLRFLGRRYNVPYGRLLGAYLMGANFLKHNREPKTPTQIRNVAFVRLIWGGDTPPKKPKKPVAARESNDAQKSHVAT